MISNKNSINLTSKKTGENLSIKRLSKNEWMINGIIYYLMYEMGSLKWFHMGGEARLLFDYYEDINEVETASLWDANNLIDTYK